MAEISEERLKEIVEGKEGSERYNIDTLFFVGLQVVVEKRQTTERIYGRIKDYEHLDYSFIKIAVVQKIKNVYKDLEEDGCYYTEANADSQIGALVLDPVIPITRPYDLKKYKYICKSFLFVLLDGERKTMEENNAKRSNHG